MPARELYCDRCQGMQLFEVPPCADGHGSECPELACTRCGAAMLTAMVSTGADRTHQRRGPAPAPGRAA